MIRSLLLALVAQSPVPIHDAWQPLEDACTSILVSAGATVDGSVMITYSADAPFLPRLLHVEGSEHESGATTDVWGWENEDRRGPDPASGADLHGGRVDERAPAGAR